MIRFRKPIEVARLIDDVFAYVSNFGNAAQWDPGVAESLEASSGPIGAGMAFKLRVRFGPRSIPMEYTMFRCAATRRWSPAPRRVSGRLWLRSWPSSARELLPVIDAVNDQPTADLLTQRLEGHKRTAWIRCSLFEH